MISIVIPVYNAAHTLEDTLSSILVSEYKDYEIILVEDGSTDESGKVCDDLAKEHTQIRVLHQRRKSLRF